MLQGHGKEKIIEDPNIHTFKHTHVHTQTTGGRKKRNEGRKGIRKEGKDDRKKRERRQKSLS